MLFRFGVLAVLFGGFWGGVVCAEEAPEISFEKHIRPILKQSCFHCHGEEEELAGGLDIRLRRFLVAGGDSGPAIMPNDAEASYLIERLQSKEMPPSDAGQPLPAKQIELIARWINRGAPTLRDEPKVVGHGLLISEEDRRFWSFQPPANPPIPQVQHLQRVANPIDAFILQKLEANGLSMAPRANRWTLVRRAYLDLTGLPPTYEQSEAFIQDEAPDAWGRLLDTLLASPHYGERWGRHWLDLAGYADSEGVTNADTERKWAWKYRDYVIASLNADKPYDQFVREQIAGDEMAPPPYVNMSSEKIEKMVATGFLRMAPDGTASGAANTVTARNEVIAKTVEITTSTLLGLTVKCAQCHEHRYDPISQADYHRIRAIFEPALDWKKWKAPPKRLLSLYTDDDRKKAAKIEERAKAVLAERTKRQAEFIEAVFQKELAKVPKGERETVGLARNTAKKDRTEEQKLLLRKHPSVNVNAGSLYLFDRKAADALKKMTAEAAKIRATKPAEHYLRVLTETPGAIPTSFVFNRGDPEQPKQEVKPAGLSVLHEAGFVVDPIAANDAALPTSGRRLSWAKQLTNGRHPLLSRVFVNRVWMHHFGRGIVATSGDFGQLGERPSHPELLDWLANQFVRDDWSMKRLHKLIMLSHTYCQSMRSDTSVDPEHALFSGWIQQRLDAETLRDSILAVSGKLNTRRFGPPVPVMADRIGQWVIGKENLNAGRPGPVLPMHGENFRRSVFIQVRRSRPLAVLEMFDAPRMDPNCESRVSSTVATQSLMLMNGAFVLGQAEYLAERLMKETGPDTSAQIQRIWHTIYRREATAEELQEAKTFLAEQTADLAQRAGKTDNPQKQAVASLCQTLLGSNEFLYVD